MSIVTLCVAVVLLGGGAATAAPGDPATQSSQVGAIHLRKYDNAEGQKDPTGVEGQELPGGAKPLSGITYHLTPVLRTPDIEDVAKAAVTTKDLGKIRELTASRVEAALADRENNSDWGFGKTLKAMTDDSGAIDWENLDLGVYLLQETKLENPKGSYHRSPPSLISLPTPDPSAEHQNTRWLMDAEGNFVTWVYPKNSLEENIKSVVDTNGKTISYTVSMSIPAVRELSVAEKAGLETKRDYNLSDFGLWDNLDESLTFHQEDEVTVSYGVGGVSLLGEGDFVVKVFEPAAGTSGQKLAVALTSAGLDKVAQAKKGEPDTRVFITFKPTLTSPGVVPNKARVYKTLGAGESLTTNNAQLPFNPPKGSDTFETNTVVSAWGSLKINKTNVPAPGETAVNLEGATFALVAGQGGEKIAEGVTDKDGMLTFESLQASDLRNGGNPNTPVEYALIETQAPPGYQLLAEPIAVSLNAAKFNNEANWSINDEGVVAFEPNEDENHPELATQADMDAWTAGQDIPVANVAAVYQLPLTGGSGVAIFFLLGGLVLVAAKFASRRKV